MAVAQLMLLGDFELRQTAGQPADALGQKDKALIAVLALQPGKAHTRDRLAGLLWSDRGQQQARDSLKHSLTRLRHSLLEVSPQPIVADRQSIRLDATSVNIDVTQLERLLDQGSTEATLEAMAIYRGDLLEGLSIRDAEFQEWLLLERQKVRRRLEEGLISLLAKLMATRENDRAGEVARRLISLDPLQEVGYRALMQALSDQGQTAQALKLYEGLTERLRRELGVKPEPETARLHETLRQRRLPIPANEPQPPTKPLIAIMPHQNLRNELEQGCFADGMVEEVIDNGWSGRARPITQYTKSGDVSIAFQVSGKGRTDLVYVQGWVSNLEYAWESPDYARFIARLAGFSRLIRFDRRGVGMSDRDVGPWTLEQRVDDIRAVMDAVGSKRATLLASSEGGHMSLMFAATHPERTSGLILNGCYAREAWAPDYPWGVSQEVHEASLAELERDWGGPFQLHLSAPSMINDDAASSWLGAYLRHSASLGAAKAALRLSYSLDVRQLLPSTHVPALVLHRRGDRWVPIEHGRYLAAHIPDCKFVELPGIDHAMWWGEQEPMFAEIQKFLTGARDSLLTDRVLLTILVTEIVGSTEKAASLGATKVVRRELKNFGGEEINSRGNGFVLAFAGPTRGIQCAQAIKHDLERLGLQVRAGLHAGECERRDGVFSGLTLHIAARIASMASSSSILVSSTVKDLVVGSGLKFDSQGSHSLNGVPGDWSLLSVVG